MNWNSREILARMGVPDDILRIVNEAGRCFEVRCIRKGDHYGLHDCLIHNEDEPVIEFQDITPEETNLTPEPHFIARYPAATILQRPDHVGLWLYGYNMAWRIGGDEVQQVREWIARQGLE
jgi:hypothetical protein